MTNVFSPHVRTPGTMQPVGMVPIEFPSGGIPRTNIPLAETNPGEPPPTSGMPAVRSQPGGIAHSSFNHRVIAGSTRPGVSIPYQLNPDPAWPMS